MNLEEARQFALSLPGAFEAPHFEMSSFRVHGIIFATVPPDGDHLHVFVQEQETRAAVADNPKAYEELWWGKRLAGVQVTLAAADAERVREMLEEAWERKAPKTATRRERPSSQARPRPRAEQRLGQMNASAANRLLFCPKQRLLLAGGENGVLAVLSTVG